MPFGLTVYNYEFDNKKIIIITKLKSKVNPLTTFPWGFACVYEKILILILPGLVCSQQVSCTLYEDWMKGIKDCSRLLLILQALLLQISAERLIIKELTY